MSFSIKNNKLVYNAPFLVLFFIIICPFAVFYNFFDPYTTIKWVISLALINLLIFSFLFKEKKIILPQLPTFSLYILGLIIFLIFFNAYLHKVPLFSYENIRRFIFWAASLFFLNFFYSHKEKGFNQIENAIYMGTWFFLLSALTRYILIPTEQPYLTFGNINLSAEFIGFSLAFQFGSLIRLWEKSKKSLFLSNLTALSLTYLYFTYCRSIYIGVLLIIMAAIFFKKSFLRKL